MTINTLKHVSEQFKQHKGQNLGHAHFWVLRIGPKFFIFRFSINIVVMDIDIGVFDDEKHFETHFEAKRRS